jgi:hypothetical protein
MQQEKLGNYMKWQIKWLHLAMRLPGNVLIPGKLRWTATLWSRRRRTSHDRLRTELRTQCFSVRFQFPALCRVVEYLKWRTPAKQRRISDAKASYSCYVLISSCSRYYYTLNFWGEMFSAVYDWSSHVPVHVIQGNMAFMWVYIKLCFRTLVKTFRIKFIFLYGEELLAPRPNTNLEEHPSSAVRDCSFNIFAGGRLLHTQNYNFTSGFMWVRNLVSDIMGGI